MSIDERAMHRSVPVNRLPWTGYYINLGRSDDRRRSIETELSKAGIAEFYTRFEGVDGRTLPPRKTGLSNGELGCLRSHQNLIEARHGSDRFIHVLEDDAVLAESFRAIIEPFIQKGLFNAFDLIFTNVIIMLPSVANIHSLKVAYDEATARAPDFNFELINLRGLKFMGADSYFINPASLEKIRAILERECAPNSPLAWNIDMIYRHEVDANHLRAACVFPFVSTVDIDLAQASTSIARPHMLPHDLFRFAFYIDRDLEAARAKLAQLNPQSADDPFLDLLADIHRALIVAGR